jgi:hypothetical protein
MSRSTLVEAECVWSAPMVDLETNEPKYWARVLELSSPGST